MSGVCEKIDASKPPGGKVIDYKILISRGNLLDGWQKFCRGKWKQQVVRNFWLKLEENLGLLYHDLSLKKYRHRPYRHFVVTDGKKRDIYVAAVRDRVVQQILADYLAEIFDPIFYFHSYAARNGKGLQRARKYCFKIMKRLGATSQTHIAKLDIRKYFASIDHKILMKLLERRIHDHDILALMREVIGSFGENGQGLPLGNLTSQWFANIYLHELDYYAKQNLKICYYLRYNDDMIIIGSDRRLLAHQAENIRKFVSEKLLLAIPDEKFSICSLPQAVDILGKVFNGRNYWLRPKTAKRAKVKLAAKRANLSVSLTESVITYYDLGVDLRYYLSGL